MPFKCSKIAWTPQKQPPARTAVWQLLAGAKGESAAGAGKGDLGVSGRREPSARKAVQVTRPTMMARAIPRPMYGLFMVDLPGNTTYCTLRTVYWMREQSIWICFVRAAREPSGSSARHGRMWRWNRAFERDILRDGLSILYIERGHGYVEAKLLSFCAQLTSGRESSGAGNARAKAEIARTFRNEISGQWT